MKNLLCILFLFSAVTVSAQTTDFKLGAHAGLPVGDMNEAYSYNAGANLSYMVGIAGLVEFGALVGYMHYFEDSGKEGDLSWEGNDASYIPMAGSGRIDMGPVFAGMDIGYALGLNEGNDGGFFYRPKIGFGFLGLTFVGSYSGISADGIEVNSINLGLEFSF
ncbi:hypothetical protein SAMN06296241_2833 [Salinimicrobium sediminis]|uniref:Outer membrane protein beta-barrel domain-containing protein n=1 Tax=Salinimicrobium sediminis TaxID=1343891 RepID=A0A285X9Z4_9FLAO|nr:hypothetical protein [Salinimicrobium sediminis]SOC81259.1 hypothetical protein SAMN06296241_2833 [Salinimicrobium sediminis]